MIAACPKCSARYRVDAARIGPEGARLKCAKCDAVFRVRAPDAVPAPAEPTIAAVPPPQVAPAPAVEAPPPADTRPDPEKLVVVADPEVENGKRTASALTSWGLQPILVHDGVEAMLTIQRMLPKVVILDAALPKMYGFQVCEVVKRNESLRETMVVLIGAIHQKDRYRRPPTELYGADAYLERPDLPEGLMDILRQAGVQVAGSAPAGPTGQPVPLASIPLAKAAVPVQTLTEAPQSAPAAAPAPAPVAAIPEPAPVAAAAPVPAEPAAAPPVAAPASDGLEDDERAKAERLARIIVSDILLYNPEKFEAAVSGGGDVVEALDGELQEGRGLFAQRVEARVRDSRDFLGEELRRVAEERRAR